MKNIKNMIKETDNLLIDFYVPESVNIEDKEELDKYYNIYYKYKDNINAIIITNINSVGNIVHEEQKITSEMNTIINVYKDNEYNEKNLLVKSTESKHHYIPVMKNNEYSFHPIKNEEITIQYEYDAKDRILDEYTKLSVTMNEDKYIHKIYEYYDDDNFNCQLLIKETSNDSNLLNYIEEHYEEPDGTLKIVKHIDGLLDTPNTSNEFKTELRLYYDKKDIDRLYPIKIITKIYKGDYCIGKLESKSQYNDLGVLMSESITDMETTYNYGTDVCSLLLMDNDEEHMGCTVFTKFKLLENNSKSITEMLYYDKNNNLVEINKINEEVIKYKYNKNNQKVAEFYKSTRPANNKPSFINTKTVGKPKFLIREICEYDYQGRLIASILPQLNKVKVIKYSDNYIETKYFTVPYNVMVLYQKEYCKKEIEKYGICL